MIWKRENRTQDKTEEVQRAIDNEETYVGKLYLYEYNTMDNREKRKEERKEHFKYERTILMLAIVVLIYSVFNLTTMNNVGLFREISLLLFSPAILLIAFVIVKIYRSYTTDIKANKPHLTDLTLPEDMESKLQEEMRQHILTGGLYVSYIAEGRKHIREFSVINDVLTYNQWEDLVGEYADLEVHIRTMYDRELDNIREEMKEEK